MLFTNDFVSYVLNTTTLLAMMSAGEIQPVESVIGFGNFHNQMWLRCTVMDLMMVLLEQWMGRTLLLETNILLLDRNEVDTHKIA